MSFRFAAFSLALVLPVLGPATARASIVTFTSSISFEAAISGFQKTVENFASGFNGQVIPNGGSFDGPTYNFEPGPFRLLGGGVITDQFNGISGFSLGGEQADGASFFFPGDSFTTMNSAQPIYAVGGFFNVSLNTGTYEIIAHDGANRIATAITGSAQYDMSTFVFDGIVSTTPFTSETFISTNEDVGSYTIPEFIAATMPTEASEPGALTLFGAGLLRLAMPHARRRGRGNLR